MKRTLAIGILLLGLVLLPVGKYGCSVHSPVPQYNEQISEIEHLYKSTVWVGTPRGDWDGSGFVIGSDDLHTYIVTCAHVVNTINKTSGNSQKVIVGVWDGESNWVVYGGNILGTRGGAFNSDGDCAVIQIRKIDIVPFKLGLDVNVNDEVWTAGMIDNPIRQIAIAPACVTVGNVTDILKEPANSFIVNTWAFPGFSGGPVYDHKTKKVVGIIAWGVGATPTICPDANTIRELLVTLKLDYLVKE